MKTEQNLASYRILLVEDEYLVGFDLRNDLVSRGAKVIGPIGDLDMAFAFVDGEPWLDAVVLDVNLRGELAFALADHLIARDIPFLFTTGYPSDVIPFRLQHILRCDKPVRPGAVAQAVAGLVPESVHRPTVAAR